MWAAQHSGREQGAGAGPWVQTPALPPPGYGNRCQPLHLSEPRFPHLQEGTIMTLQSLVLRTERTNEHRTPKPAAGTWRGCAPSAATSAPSLTALVDGSGHEGGAGSGLQPVQTAASLLAGILPPREKGLISPSKEIQSMPHQDNANANAMRYVK